MDAVFSKTVIESLLELFSKKGFVEITVKGVIDCKVCGDAEEGVGGGRSRTKVTNSDQIRGEKRKEKLGIEELGKTRRETKDKERSKDHIMIYVTCLTPSPRVCDVAILNVCL